MSDDDSKTSLHGMTHQGETLSINNRMDPKQHLYFMPEDWVRLASTLDAQRLGAIYIKKTQAARLEFASRADAETWKSDAVPSGKRVLPTLTGVEKNTLPGSVGAAINATQKSQILLVATVGDGWSGVFSALPIGITR